MIVKFLFKFCKLAIDGSITILYNNNDDDDGQLGTFQFAKN